MNNMNVESNVDNLGNMFIQMMAKTYNMIVDEFVSSNVLINEGCNCDHIQEAEIFLDSDCNYVNCNLKKRGIKHSHCEKCGGIKETQIDIESLGFNAETTKEF